MANHADDDETKSTKRGTDPAIEHQRGHDLPLSQRPTRTRTDSSTARSIVLCWRTMVVASAYVVVFFIWEDFSDAGPLSLCLSTFTFLDAEDRNVIRPSSRHLKLWSNLTTLIQHSAEKSRGPPGWKPSTAVPVVVLYDAVVLFKISTLVGAKASWCFHNCSSFQGLSRSLAQMSVFPRRTRPV